jgi:hypothetical protein
MAVKALKLMGRIDSSQAKEQDAELYQVKTFTKLHGLVERW